MNFNPALFASKADMETVRAFMGTLFRGWDWKRGGVIALRGIGEAGTPQEGKFRENKFIDPRNVFGFSQIETHLNRWGENGIASFVLPGIVDDKAVDTGDVREDKVRAFCALMLDIDSGNVDEKMQHCMDWLGEPSMVVNSGGITDKGHNKVHAYWVLSEPSERVADIGRARKLLAAKVGGDQSFGRPAQVIRIAGSTYGKGGMKKPVELVHRTDRVYDLSDLIDTIESMEWMEGCAPSQGMIVGANGVMDFSAGAGLDPNRIAATLTTDVHAGGVDGATRWDSFNAVAGHHINCVRKGLETLDSARELTWGWVLSHMVPAWERERFEREWVGMVNHDVASNGEFVTSAPAIVPPAAVQAHMATKIEPLNTTDDLLSWSVDNRTTDDPAPREDLVEGLVSRGLRHLLVSEGGAGKTFLMLDLFLKLAASRPNGPVHKWLGQPVTPHAYGGTYVLFTAEDNQASLNRRWHGIDPGKALRREAGERLIVIPFDNTGGSFPLMSRKPYSTDFDLSPQWARVVSALYGLIERGHRIEGIGIDTMNATIHGDENSAEVIAQYMRGLAPVTGAIGAFVMLSHHVRKLKDDKPVDGPEKMLEAIRGSAAIKDNVRVAIGLWQAPDYREQMDLMGLPVQARKLYKVAVVKSNEPMLDGERYLMRQPSGILQECDAAVKGAQRTADMRSAWLLFCIDWYAERGLFFTATGRESGIYKQRNRFHECIAAMGKDPITALVEKLLQGNRSPLFKVAIQSRSKEVQWLDLRSKKNRVREWHNPEEVVEDPLWSDFEYDAFHGKIVPRNGDVM